MTSYPRECTLCHNMFRTDMAFWRHYILEKYRDTRCMSTEEMFAYGYYYTNGEYETWGDHHRDKWDPDRHFWGMLYKPAQMFDDMFPIPPAPKVSWLSRLLFKEVRDIMKPTTKAGRAVAIAHYIEEEIIGAIESGNSQSLGIGGD